jgi:type IV pilus assembly protein PilM
MQNPFNLFFKQQSYLAVDIGTTSIKAVELEQGERGPKIVNYGVLESSGYLARANQALQTSSLKIFEADIIQLLKTLVTQMGVKSKDALASLPPFSVFTTILDFPQMDQREIQQAMIYQARQYVPQPLAEVALDWLQVGEYQDDRGFNHQKIMLISVPKEQIQKYQRIFNAAGFALRALEIESIGLARIFGGDQTPTLIIDIGSRSTNIVFMENGRMTFSGQSDFGGASLTQSLATSLGVNPLRAEELKKEKGLLGTGANYELSTIMLPFLDAILNEIKKVQFLYQQQLPMARPAQRIILAGGGANLLGIEKYFEHEFGIPVVKAAPFLKFEHPSEIEPFVPELNPLMSVSLGLGIKQFAK